MSQSSSRSLTTHFTNFHLKNDQVHVGVKLTISLLVAAFSCPLHLPLQCKLPTHYTSGPQSHLATFIENTAQLPGVSSTVRVL